MFYEPSPSAEPTYLDFVLRSLPCRMPRISKAKPKGKTVSRIHAAPKARAKKTAKKEVNYAGKNQAKTDALHARILHVLQDIGAGLTVREISEAVGISRQLCLYHVKKMVAHHTPVLAMLEPCDINGGVRYMVWDRMALSVALLKVAA